MPEHAGSESRAPSRLGLLGRVRSASFLSIGVVVAAIAAQLAVPRVLLSTWGDSGYAFLIAVQGFAAYVSVADAGVLLHMSRRLAILHAAGDERSALALIRGGLRTFAILATAGTGIVFGAFMLSGRRIWHGLAITSGLTPQVAVVAALAQVVSGATSLALGGWSSAVDQGRSRYARVPAYALGRMTLVTCVTLGLAELGLGPGATLLCVSGLSIVFEALRFAHTRRTEGPLASVSPDPVGGVLRDARGSLLYYLATTTQNGLQPYVTAALSPSVVSIAVPARTLANGARSMSGAVVAVIWIPVAARLFELKDASDRLRFWRRNSPTLSAVQVGGVVALLALAPLVVPHWLPAKSESIMALLPFYCVEQGAYVAIIPSTVLLQATGSFATLGYATLAAAIASVAGTMLLVPHYGAAGFAGASAASVLLVLAPSVLAVEWGYWRRGGVSPASVLAPRVGTALLVAACAIPYAHHHAATVVGMSVILAVVAVYALRSRRGV